MYFGRWWWLSSLCALFLTTSPSEVFALTLTTGQRIASRKTNNNASFAAVAAPTPISDIPLPIDPSRNPQQNQLQMQPKKYKSLFDLPAVENWGTQQGLKEHHLKTLYKFVMNDFNNNNGSSPLSLEERLAQAEFPKRHATNLLTEFALHTCSILRVEGSDGGYKFVIQLSSGNLVETVLIRHTRNNGHVRYTVCVSSQVGCAKKCSFCATGTMGLKAQLTSGEILEQVYLAKNYLASVASSSSSSSSSPPSESIADDDMPSTTETARSRFRVKPNGVIRNVVFMGMGEPMDNYDEVHESLRGLTHQYLFQLNAKHITVSTVGASARKIRLLADEAPQVNLALSLHSAIQESRELLIPSANANPMKSLGESLDYHSTKSGRGAMIEYLLIDKVNDSDAEVDALAKFCQERNEHENNNSKNSKVFVNLIPYNPTLAGDDFGYETPSDDRIYAFHNRLKDLGVNSLVRWSSTQGRDANGACGQLALNSSTV